MEDFDKLTDDATTKHKRFMELIQGGKAELEQIKTVIVEKIAVHDNVITDLIYKVNQSTQNALAIRLDLHIVRDNCQKMKTQMYELLAALSVKIVMDHYGR